MTGRQGASARTEIGGLQLAGRSAIRRPHLIPRIKVSTSSVLLSRPCEREAQNGLLDSRRMRIPADAVVPAEKLSHYLLVSRPWDDKAKFLAQAGFDRERPETLLRALRELAAQGDAVSDGANEYGEFLRLDGILVGPNGRQLAVTTIWLRQHIDGPVRFVTLKPRKEKAR